MDYDFITTCNWTATGTYTLRAYRGSVTNVVTTHYASIFYRKKGTSTWTALDSSGQMVVDSTGEWEVANDWNKSGNDCLTHSYRGITAINSCTDVYFNETSLGSTVGNNFLYYCWYNCSSLTSMPSGFNLPTGITSVGNYFLGYCWSYCKLTSMPTGFNLPTGITSVGYEFLTNCWYNCSSLTSMPSGFNLPTGITSVGNFFLSGCWRKCTSLTSMPAGFNLPTGITSVGNNFIYNCWNGCTSLNSMPSGFNLPTGITSVGNYFLDSCWQDCTALTSMPSGFNLPTGITTVGEQFLGYCWSYCTSLTSMPSGFNLPTGITGLVVFFLDSCWRNCTSLTSMPSGFNLPTGITGAVGSFLAYCWYNCISLKADGYTEDIDFDYSAGSTFGGTCPIYPDSPTAGSSVAVNRPPEPAVTTQDCTNIALTSVTGNGNIVAIGNSTPTTRGFCYKAGTTGDPTTSDSTVYDTGTFSTGAYTKSITGLTQGTSYRVRAYAINSDGTGYGDTVTVTTLVAISGTVTLSGTGVEGAIIRIIQQDTDEEVDKQITDSDGNYDSSQLTAGKKYHVCVEYTDGSSNKYNSKSLWDIEGA